MKLAALLMLAGCAACDNQMPDGQALAPVARLPAQLCTQATDAINKLKESGGFTYAGSGEGTLDGEAWLKMSEGQRDQLQQLLAVDSACTAREPVAEATATLRDETGRVLSQRVVQVSADLSSIPHE